MNRGRGNIRAYRGLFRAGQGLALLAMAMQLWLATAHAAMPPSLESPARSGGADRLSDEPGDIAPFLEICTPFGIKRLPDANSEDPDHSEGKVPPCPVCNWAGTVGQAALAPDGEVVLDHVGRASILLPPVRDDVSGGVRPATQARAPPARF
ncbi:MAG: hypothetical protein RIC93_11120 [Alphaproteobacteria bacterium]